MTATSIAIRQKQFVVIAVVVLIASFAGACSQHFYAATRPYESSYLADVGWESGGEPMTVVVTVRDSGGARVAGAEVHVDNNSGGQIETTDQNGVATLKMGEGDFSALDINGVRIVERPHAYRLGNPTVVDGLRVDVRLKAFKALNPNQ